MRLLFILLAAALLAFGCSEAPAEVRDISAEQLLASPAGELRLIDVRSVGEYEAGHVPGALNIPHDELRARLHELGPVRDEPVVVYCESGKRAGVAGEILLAAGFRRVLHLSGDMRGWREAGRDTER